MLPDTSLFHEAAAFCRYMEQVRASRRCNLWFNLGRRRGQQAWCKPGRLLFDSSVHTQVLSEKERQLRTMLFDKLMQAQVFFLDHCVFCGEGLHICG